MKRIFLFVLTNLAVVVVLGMCGRNFAAGMNGGIAYVLDERGDFAAKRCNLAGVDLEAVIEAEDERVLKTLIARHAALTASPRARAVLDNWPEMLPLFIKVFPHEYKRVLGIPRAPRVYVPVPAQPAHVVAKGAAMGDD